MDGLAGAIVAASTGVLAIAIGIVRLVRTRRIAPPSRGSWHAGALRDRFLVTGGLLLLAMIAGLSARYDPGQQNALITLTVLILAFGLTGMPALDWLASRLDARGRPPEERGSPEDEIDQRRDDRS
jgi:hypothetical protein